MPRKSLLKTYLRACGPPQHPAIAPRASRSSRSPPFPRRNRETKPKSKIIRYTKTNHKLSFIAWVEIYITDRTPATLWLARMNTGGTAFKTAKILFQTILLHIGTTYVINYLISSTISKGIQYLLICNCIISIKHMTQYVRLLCLQRNN